jgi:plasmid stabilization system protein ParE
MALIWSEAAIADLVRIRNYIAEYNPEAAGQVAMRLMTVAELLSSSAHIGVATRRPNVRRVVVAQSVYSLIYRIAGENIEIIEVFDGRRKRPRTDVRR